MTCIKCGKPSKYRYSPDMDIRGLGACEEHKELVHMAYIALCTSGEELYKQILGK